MKKTIYILLAAMGFASCNYLEIEPVGKVIPHKTSEFRALLTEGYQSFPFYNSKTFTGLLSDEIGVFVEGKFYTASDAIALSYNYTWQYGSQMREYPYQEYYRTIFYANAVIDGVMDSDADTDASDSKEQILGEAYALRAYAHFDLTNLYGKPYDPETAATDRTAPLSTTIDIEQIYRPSNVAAIYEQIVEDIENAERLMTVEKQPDATRNYRFSADALMGFKARVMLDMRNWQAAYDSAKSLLPKYNLVDFNAAVETNALPWKATSEEAILAWERPFSFSSGDLIAACVISEKILNLIDETTDKRRAYLKAVNVYDETWTPTLVGYGVNRATGDRVSIRIAEMYLIAAEAGSYLPSELNNAKKYLLDLQKKRLTPEGYAAKETAVEAMDSEQLRAEVADERARELLMEGHRWMDLRRTTRPAITKTHNGSTYTLTENDSRYTLPFPQSAVNNNPHLND